MNGANGEGKESFNVSGFRNLYGGNSPLPGQIGCAVSHYRLMGQFARANGDPNDWMLVAEDDVLFTPEFSKVLDNLLRLKIEANLLVLAGAGGDGGVRDASSYSERYFQQSFLTQRLGKSWSGDLYTLGTYSGVLWGAGLYMVQRKAAISYVDFVERCGGIHWLADDWNYFSSPSELTLKTVRPPLADFEGTSEIRENDKHKKHYYQQKSLRDVIAIRTRFRQVKGRISATLDDFSTALKLVPKD